MRRSRIEYWRHIRAHWTVKLAFVIWGTLGAVSIVLPFCPATWSEKFYGLSYIPKWHWYVWVIGLLVIAAFALFEVGHSVFAETGEVTPSDPYLYLDLIDRRRELSRRTPLSVTNKGGGTARKIQIHPIRLRKGTAEFREIDHLGVGLPVEAVPEIENAGVLFRYDLLNLLQHEANESGEAEQLTVRASVTYKNQTESRCFTLPFEIIFNSIRFMLHKDDDSPLNKINPIIEIKHGKVFVGPC